MKNKKNTLIICLVFIFCLFSINHCLVNAATTYQLTFSANGGTLNNNVTNPRILEAGQMYGTLPIPKKTHYTFSGWFTDVSAGTKVGANTRMGTENKTIYAHWQEIPTYTLTFNNNNGDSSTIPEKILEEGEKYGTLSTPPTRDGYVFVGWYTQSSGGQKVTSNTRMGNANTTLYAHWDTVDISHGSVAQQRWHTTITNPTHVGPGKITVRKRIPRYRFDQMETANQLNSKAVFQFLLEGTTIDNQAFSSTKTINFNTAIPYKQDPDVFGDEYVILTATFENVDHGVYTLKEVNPNTIEKIKNTTYNIPENAQSTFMLDDTSVTDSVQLSADKKTATITINKDNYNADFSVDYRNLPTEGSLKILKKGKNNAPLKGVEFTLVNKDAPDTLIKINGQNPKTDAEGKIEFKDLHIGTYILKEINTVDGNNLLKDPIEFSIPYAVTDAEVERMHIDTTKGIKSQTTDLYYFYDLTYNISNNASLSLPHTGIFNDWYIPLILGFAFIGIALFINKKKKSVSVIHQ